MLALIEFVSLAALVAFHTLVAGVAARFFRLRLSPWSARALYTVVLTPVLFVSTLFFTGVLGVGTGLVVESPVIVVSLLVGLPLVLGVVRCIMS